jgi:hypothetical protein
MMLFDPRWVWASKGADNIVGRKTGKKKKETDNLCSDSVAGGWDGITERENLKNWNMKKVT